MFVEVESSLGDGGHDDGSRRAGVGTGEGGTVVYLKARRKYLAMSKAAAAEAEAASSHLREGP